MSDARIVSQSLIFIYFFAVNPNLVHSVARLSLTNGVASATVLDELNGLSAYIITFTGSEYARTFKIAHGDILVTLTLNTDVEGGQSDSRANKHTDHRRKVGRTS